ncbi:hypothetical protein Esi_0162_0044 [Ectocarpus siliculosus]|uniref:Uncharacterized protein n=1 Tax=Ectocarpus siliculosus TaxID=2880 RepID=D7FLZ4_ECTSI|nr:hypothetical protein Esi_0162_0044 [Ectocarpus siliculosus]|eukprot:CBJ29819.1 hypothetical protein Esi_0162_0044 [Ectocarpus siliculosus]
MCWRETMAKTATLGRDPAAARCRRKRSRKRIPTTAPPPTAVASWRHPPLDALPRNPLLVALVVVALLGSVADAGGGSGNRGSESSVPWWYPSRDWGLPSDAVGSGGGEAGGGGGWTGLGVPRRRFREEAKLAEEFVASWVASGLAEEEERRGGSVVMPACDVLEAGNHTLRRLGASVDRCASPYYALPEIHPSQLVYTEVDPAEAAEKREREERAAARRKKRQQEAKKNNSKAGGSAGQSSGDGEEDHGDDEEEEDNFLGIFLFLKGDFFSVELENALTSIMPAYPRAWVVKANAPSFLSTTCTRSRSCFSSGTGT